METIYNEVMAILSRLNIQVEPDEIFISNKSEVAAELINYFMDITGGMGLGQKKKS